MNKNTRNSNALVLVAATCIAVIALAELGGGTAEAIVGRPLTPMSYAGVARRTTRRAAVFGAPAPVAVAPAAMTALPAGCARIAGTAVRYQCGADYYAPEYSGPNVVYVPVEVP